MTALENMLEAFNADPEAAPPSLERGLLAVAPPPADVDAQKLEEEAAHHRVLLLKTGAVIAISSMLALGLALLIHLLLAGVIVVGMLFPWTGPAGGSQHPAGAEEIGPGGGALILGNPLADSKTPQAASVIGSSGQSVPANLAVAMALPALPAPSALTATPSLIPAPEPLSELAPLDPGVPTIPPPPNASRKASSEVLIKPPDRSTAAIAPPEVSRASGGLNSAGPAAEDTGPAGGDDGEPVFSLVSGDGTQTVGEGGRVIGDAGKGAGMGLDRGPSFANREAEVIDNPVRVALPPGKRLPDKNVKLAATVEADGTVSAVRVVGSCGDPEIDELYREAALALVRCSPKIEGGKAVRSDVEFGYAFKPFD